jgi:transcriptional regulator
MYIPKAFEAADLRTQHDLIRTYPFGTLVSGAAGEPVASHLPFLLESDDVSPGALLGHMARANPQWEAFKGRDPALVMFQGPHAYISPTWYATAPSVPTWNYTAVHVYGIPQIVTDRGEAYRNLECLARRFEGDGDGAWDIQQLPSEYLDRLVESIVVFRIPIDRIEGKLKLSQNRSRPDREGAIRGLLTTQDPLAKDLADWMDTALNGSGAKGDE